MIKDGIKLIKKLSNVITETNTDNDNIEPSQQPAATNTPSRFLNDTLTPPQDNIDSCY